MSEFTHDVFISYFSGDRSDITRIVNGFREQGLDVWWDKNLRDGRWGEQLDDHLRDSRKVVVFLSKSLHDRRLDYVAAEMDIAIATDKLIPIIIGDFQIPIIYNSRIIGLQTFSFSTFDHALASEEMSFIYSLCGAVQSNNSPLPKKPIDRFLSDMSIGSIALALSIAALESSPVSTITAASLDLERRLLEPDADKSPHQNHRDIRPAILSTRTARFRAVHAITFAETHPRLRIPLECARFEDKQRAFELFAYTWDELDQFHSILVDWLNDLACSLSPDGRARLGLMLGAIARTRFIPVFQAILRGWLMDDDPRCRELADIALTVASQDPSIKGAVRNIITDLSRSSSPIELRAAIELACGYSGTRIEDLPISILKTVAKAGHADFDVLLTMRDSIAFLIRSNLDSADNSLLDLKSLIASLADWVERPDDGTPQRLPMWLYLRLLDSLPLQSPSDVFGVLSLSSLMANQETRVAIGRVFAAALADGGDTDFSPREDATQIIRDWLDMRTKEAAVVEPGNAPDIVLELIRALYAACLTPRDRDRIAFIVRRHYDRWQIDSDASVDAPNAEPQQALKDR